MTQINRDRASIPCPVSQMLQIKNSRVEDISSWRIKHQSDLQGVDGCKCKQHAICRFGKKKAVTDSSHRLFRRI